MPKSPQHPCVAYAPSYRARAPRNLHMNPSLVYTLEAPPNHWLTGRHIHNPISTSMTYTVPPTSETKRTCSTLPFCVPIHRCTCPTCGRFTSVSVTVLVPKTVLSKCIKLSIDVTCRTYRQNIRAVCTERAIHRCTSS